MALLDQIREQKTELEVNNDRSKSEKSRLDEDIRKLNLNITDCSGRQKEREK